MKKYLPIVLIVGVSIILLIIIGFSILHYKERPQLKGVGIEKVQKKIVINDIVIDKTTYFGKYFPERAERNAIEIQLKSQGDGYFSPNLSRMREYLKNNNIDNYKVITKEDGKSDVISIITLIVKK